MLGFSNYHKELIFLRKMLVGSIASQLYTSLFSKYYQTLQVCQNNIPSNIRFLPSAVVILNIGVQKKHIVLQITTNLFSYNLLFQMVVVVICYLIDGTCMYCSKTCIFINFLKTSEHKFLIGYQTQYVQFGLLQFPFLRIGDTATSLKMMHPFPIIISVCIMSRKIHTNYINLIQS